MRWLPVRWRSGISSGDWQANEEIMSLQYQLVEQTESAGEPLHTSSSTNAEVIRAAVAPAHYSRSAPRNAALRSVALLAETCCAIAGHSAMPTAETIIEHFGLVKHPEGGYFREMYRSGEHALLARSVSADYPVQAPRPWNLWARQISGALDSLWLAWRGQSGTR